MGSSSDDDDKDKKLPAKRNGELTKVEAPRHRDVPRNMWQRVDDKLGYVRRINARLAPVFEEYVVAPECCMAYGARDTPLLPVERAGEHQVWWVAKDRDETLPTMPQITEIRRRIWTDLQAPPHHKRVRFLLTMMIDANPTTKAWGADQVKSFVDGLTYEICDPHDESGKRFSDAVVYLAIRKINRVIRDHDFVLTIPKFLKVCEERENYVRFRVLEKIAVVAEYRKNVDAILVHPEPPEPPPRPRDPDDDDDDDLNPEKRTGTP